MAISGSLPYDELDELIADLEEQGISVNSVMVLEEDDSADEDDPPIAHNDTDCSVGDNG